MHRLLCISISFVCFLSFSCWEKSMAITNTNSTSDTTVSDTNHNSPLANIFILAGQSNALGQHTKYKILDSLTQEYKGIQDSILIWRDGNYVNIPSLPGFEPMLVPINTRDKDYNDTSNFYHDMVGWSVEQEWMHRATRLYKQKVFLLKNAYGALSISQWAAPSGKMFIQLKKMISTTEHDLVAIDKVPKFRGMVWMQGEADQHTPDYYLQLKTLIKNIRSISSATENMPFIMVRILPQTLYYSAIVDSAFTTLAKEDPNRNFIIETADIPGISCNDNIHYNDLSKLILGGYIFDYQLNHGQLE